MNLTTDGTHSHAGLARSRQSSNKPPRPATLTARANPPTAAAAAGLLPKSQLQPRKDSLQGSIRTWSIGPEGKGRIDGETLLSQNSQYRKVASPSPSASPSPLATPESERNPFCFDALLAYRAPPAPSAMLQDMPQPTSRPSPLAPATRNNSEVAELLGNDDGRHEGAISAPTVGTGSDTASFHSRNSIMNSYADKDRKEPTAEVSAEAFQDAPAAPQAAAAPSTTIPAAAQMVKVFCLDGEALLLQAGPAGALRKFARQPEALDGAVAAPAATGFCVDVTGAEARLLLPWGQDKSLGHLTLAQIGQLADRAPVRSEPELCASLHALRQKLADEAYFTELRALSWERDGMRRREWASTCHDAVREKLFVVPDAEQPDDLQSVTVALQVPYIGQFAKRLNAPVAAYAAGDRAQVEQDRQAALHDLRCAWGLQRSYYQGLGWRAQDPEVKTSYAGPGEGQLVMVASLRPDAPAANRPQA